jgi:predicted NodU family carbamoyl transferase
MKIQSEFMRVGEGITYFEQYFNTTTQDKISTLEWNEIQNFIQEVVDIMSRNKIVKLKYEIVKIGFEIKAK